MNSRAIWATIVLAVIITTAGILAFTPIQEAIATISTERDNTTVTGLSTPKTPSTGLVGAVVLLDNGGIGGTSDVEVTWTAPFTDSECRLVVVAGAGFTISASPGSDPNGNPILGNDMVFMAGLGYKVAHNDITGAEAILLIDITAGTGNGCNLGKDFVTISTVGSS